MSLFGDEPVVSKKIIEKKNQPAKRVVPLNSSGGIDFTKIDVENQEKQKKEAGKIAPEIDYVGEQEANS